MNLAIAARSLSGAGGALEIGNNGFEISDE
jgi:hypothetical protein